eukprot:Cvel_15891.t2-p1 / transcript=Cvel_15891.t2 / gene=Cvel_15891 / organism=Chromera_velia_CCMP2878 / gene_product=hypothetical protein / transcript_product=hypothetical protein / location=Cvel_scaffold1200:18114-19145(-) / protein_length=344 / sequence_SO=supercontig / SO=protein_coding / is_pseudo=false
MNLTTGVTGQAPLPPHLHPHVAPGASFRFSPTETASHQSTAGKSSSASQRDVERARVPLTGNAPTDADLFRTRTWSSTGSGPYEIPTPLTVPSRGGQFEQQQQLMLSQQNQRRQGTGACEERQFTGVFHPHHQQPHPAHTRVSSMPPIYGRTAAGSGVVGETETAIAVGGSSQTPPSLQSQQQQQQRAALRLSSLIGRGLSEETGGGRASAGLSRTPLRTAAAPQAEASSSGVFPPESTAISQQQQEAQRDGSSGGAAGADPESEAFPSGEREERERAGAGGESSSAPSSSGSMFPLHWGAPVLLLPRSSGGPEGEERDVTFTVTVRYGAGKGNKEGGGEGGGA